MNTNRLRADDKTIMRVLTLVDGKLGLGAAAARGNDAVQLCFDVGHDTGALLEVRL